MNPLVASVIRTYTPIIAGQVAAWLILIHIPVLPELAVLVTAAVGGGLSLIYYTLVRVLEQQWPTAGILLGLPHSPDTYSKNTATAAVPANPTTAPAESFQPRAAYVAPEPQPEPAPAAPSTFEATRTALEALAPAETPAPAAAPEPEAPAQVVVVAPAAVNPAEPTPATAPEPETAPAPEPDPAPVNTPAP